VTIFDPPTDLADAAATIRAKSTKRLRPGDVDVITYVHVGPGEVIAAFRGAYAVGRSEEDAARALGAKLSAG
jgi:hypothetical protein